MRIVELDSGEVMASFYIQFFSLASYKTNFVFCISLEVGEANIVEDRLGSGTTDGHHSKTSVLDFVVLKLFDLFRGLVFQESTIKVEVTRFTSRSLQHFSDSQPTNDLGKTNEDKGVSHNLVLNHGVVGSGGGKALSEWVKDNTRIDGDVTSDGGHGNSSVSMVGLRTDKKMMIVRVHRERERERD